MVHFAGALPPSGLLQRNLLALPPSGLLERKVITGFKLVMEIAINVVAVHSQDNLLLDVAAALQRDFNGALEFRWLGQGEALDLILHADAPSSCPSPVELASASSKLNMTASASGCSEGEGTPSRPSRPAPSPLAGEGWGEGEISPFKQ